MSLSRSAAVPTLVAALALAACTATIGGSPGPGGADPDGGAAPGPGATGDLLRGPLATSAPPFSAVDHALAPTALWGALAAPRGTNTWWLNLVLGAGDQPVNALPYELAARDRLTVCSPAQVADPSFVFSSFLDDLSLGAAEPAGAHHLTAADALSATVEWSAGAGTMTAPLVRGMAYATMRYAGATPRVSTQHAISSATADGGGLTGTRFTLTLNNGQRWRLYAAPAITFSQAGDVLTATTAYTGSIRVALAPTDDALAALDAHAAAIPIGGDVRATAVGDRATLTFAWKVDGAGDPLMMALPHHRDQLVGAIAAPLSLRTIKGEMTGVVGATWTLGLALPTITWDAPRPIAPARVEAVRAALRADAGLRTRATDPYFFGKQVAAMARLASIADALGEAAIAGDVRASLAAELEPWLAAGSPRLRYDRTWGGIVADGAQLDPGAAFGQGYYNDHHFHYGYFLYAAAVLAHGNPGWVAAHRDAMTALVRDIASPSGDPYFTAFRNKDWFDGHSWAAGLFQFGDSRNQESSAEAVNAWYGLALWGDAIGDDRLRQLGRVMLATELASVHRYWQISTGNDIYPAAYAARKVVGVLWATKVDHATFFGNQLEYIHAIQMLPFTPITEELLPRAWIGEEYPVVATTLTRADPPIAESWRGYVDLAHAIVDPAAAWTEVSALQSFDDGATRTNALWWVATRPGA